VLADIDGPMLRVRPSPAHDDGAWIALCSPDSPAPLQAIATAVDARLAVDVTGAATDWTARFTPSDTAMAESPEVAVTKVSLGAAFEFQPRRSLPLTPL